MDVPRGSIDGHTPFPFLSRFVSFLAAAAPSVIPMAVAEEVPPKKKDKAAAAALT